MRFALPEMSGRQVVKVLERAGFSIISIKGSHAKLRHDRMGRTALVPLHKSLKRGTLASILRQTGMDAQSFVKLL